MVGRCGVMHAANVRTRIRYFAIAWDYTGPASYVDEERPLIAALFRLRLLWLVVSKILNHVETGVTAVYDHHSYDLEKRAALDFWGKRWRQ